MCFDALLPSSSQRGPLNTDNVHTKILLFARGVPFKKILLALWVMFMTDMEREQVHTQVLVSIPGRHSSHRCFASCKVADSCAQCSSPDQTTP